MRQLTSIGHYGRVVTENHCESSLRPERVTHRQVGVRDFADRGANGQRGVRRELLDDVPAANPPLLAGRRVNCENWRAV